MKSDEENIVHLLKLGDKVAYKYIYDHHYNLLCSIAYEYLQDYFLSATIVDDLIFYLWDQRENICINTSLRAYLIRATRNRCINHLNSLREKKEFTFSSINPIQQNQALHSESLEYPLAVLLEKELEREIKEAIDSLPYDCKRVFTMSRWEGKQYKQIAEELNISVNTVKYHMKNALANLSEKLSKYLIIIILFYTAN